MLRYATSSKVITHVGSNSLCQGTRTLLRKYPYSNLHDAHSSIPEWWGPDHYNLSNRKDLFSEKKPDSFYQLSFKSRERSLEVSADEIRAKLIHSRALIAQQSSLIKSGDSPIIDTGEDFGRFQFNDNSEIYRNVNPFSRFFFFCISF